MQSGADVPDPSRAGRRQPHPTPMPLSITGPLPKLPTTDPYAFPAAAAHSSPTSAESISAIDLEAQNGSRLASHVPRSSAGVTAAASDLELRHIGSGNDDGDAIEEPADIASERARADSLWAASHGHNEGNTSRDGCSGESTSPAGPAILLHNLRKVCEATKSHTECRKNSLLGMEQEFVHAAAVSDKMSKNDRCCNLGMLHQSINIKR